MPASELAFIDLMDREEKPTILAAPNERVRGSIWLDLFFSERTDLAKLLVSNGYMLGTVPCQRPLSDSTKEKCATKGQESEKREPKSCRGWFKLEKGKTRLRCTACKTSRPWYWKSHLFVGSNEASESSIDGRQQATHLDIRAALMMLHELETTGTICEVDNKAQWYKLFYTKIMAMHEKSHSLPSQFMKVPGNLFTGLTNPFISTFIHDIKIRRRRRR